jgi:hypothetical protein
MALFLGCLAVGLLPRQALANHLLTRAYPTFFATAWLLNT